MATVFQCVYSGRKSLQLISVVEHFSEQLCVNLYRPLFILLEVRKLAGSI